MKKLTILIDLDGIVTDLLQKWVDGINAKWKRKLTIEDVIDWDPGNLTKTKDLGGKVFKIIQQPLFFYDLDPLPGSVAGVKALVDAGHQVLFLSKPANIDSAYEKLLWVQKHFPFVGSHNTILTKHKHLVKGDVFIDDHHENVQKYLAAWPEATVMTVQYPYNRHLKGQLDCLWVGDYTDMVTTWANIVTAVEKLSL